MLSKFQNLETGIRVGGVEVKPVESVRDLGVKLDCQLNKGEYAGSYQHDCIGLLISSQEV